MIKVLLMNNRDFPKKYFNGLQNQEMIGVKKIIESNFLEPFKEGEYSCDICFLDTYDKTKEYDIIVPYNIISPRYFMDVETKSKYFFRNLHDILRNHKQTKIYYLQTDDKGLITLKVCPNVLIRLFNQGKIKFPPSVNVNELETDGMEFEYFLHQWRIDDNIIEKELNKKIIYKIHHKLFFPTSLYPVFNFEQVTDFSQKKYVIYYGGWRKERKDNIQNLLQGLTTRVDLYGNRIKNYEVDGANYFPRIIDTEKMMRILSAYKYSILTCEERVKNLGNIPSRIFEGLICGCLQFCDKRSYPLDILGDEYFYVENAKELQKKIDELDSDYELYCLKLNKQIEYIYKKFGLNEKMLEFKPDNTIAYQREDTTQILEKLEQDSMLFLNIKNDKPNKLF